MNTYTISEDGQSITCNLCGMRSYNRNDIVNIYCGHCHHWHETLPEQMQKQALKARSEICQHLRPPSLWRRYCNWFDGLSWQAKTSIILALTAIATTCIVDFIRKVIP